MTHVTRQSATNAVFAIGLALGTNLLPAVVDDAALAKDSPAATPLAIEQSIVALPTLLIPAGGKAVFTLDATDREAMPEVLLRLEAFIPFGQDAGYTKAARIHVNGTVLDASHFPVNWGDHREWSIPGIEREGMRLYSADSQAWTARYDADRWPPDARSRYHSPEMADKYVYMFPIGDLLYAGANRIEIDNTVDAHALQLLAPAVGPARTVANLRATETTETTLTVAWDGSVADGRLDYRPTSETSWGTVQHVANWENPYTLILLRPGTEYEVRLGGTLLGTADLQGKVGPLRTIASDILRAKTREKPILREFTGLTLHPTRPIPGGLTTYPCIESHGGQLWLTDSKLVLLKLDPTNGKLIWKRDEPLAGWPFPSPRAYMGIPDTTIHDGKLWVMYNAQATRNPEGYEITQSRQLLLSYDFATDTASEPVWVEPSRPEYGSWEGGVQSWRGQLWVMHMDVWTEKDVRRTKIVLRTFAEGKFGEPIVYDNCPTVYPYGPSISVYDDQLVLLFSDLAATEQNRNREPLLYSVFNGHRFSDARVLHDLGRNRYAKGVQVGDRFVCAFKCSSPYFEKHGYQYHDIALSTFRPGSEKPVRTTMYVTDRKYNSSPDVTLHDGSVFVVYNKFEHLYGQSDNPAVNYDDFIGWLLPVVPGNTDSPRNHTNTTPTSPDPSRQDSNSR